MRQLPTPVSQQQRGRDPWGKKPAGKACGHARLPESSCLLSAERKDRRPWKRRELTGAPELCLFHLFCKRALLSCVETTQSEKEPPKTARFSESDMVANACTLSTQKA